MLEDSKSSDLGTVWKNQPKEERPVNLENLMDRRSREMDSATRAEILISLMAAIFFAAIMAWRFGADQSHVPVIGFAAVVGWVVISLYWFRGRLWGTGTERTDTLAVTGLEHYRNELARRRDHLRNAWVWHGPLVLAFLIPLTVLGRRGFPMFRDVRQVLPLVLLLALWTAFGWLRRRRKAEDLQREIKFLSVT
jgi:hypothetical protein